MRGTAGPVAGDMSDRRAQGSSDPNAWSMIRPAMCQSSVNGYHCRDSAKPAGTIARPPPFQRLAAKLWRLVRRRLGRSRALRPGRVRFGDLRRVRPLSDWLDLTAGHPSIVFTSRNFLSAIQPISAGECWK